MHRKKYNFSKKDVDMKVELTYTLLVMIKDERNEKNETFFEPQKAYDDHGRILSLYGGCALPLTFSKIIIQCL